MISLPIANGGMATVHLAVSPDPRRRVLAVKKVLPNLANDAIYTNMLLMEARIASAVCHENVLRTHGVERLDGELCLVMDYVAGLSLDVVRQETRGSRIPVRFALAIMADALRGLHAAHEAASAEGAPLGIVHRDISPHNILCGADGVARVIDFGVAKANPWKGETRAGTLKGKVAYMAPEQLREGAVDRRADIFAAAIVLWELLVGEDLFKGATELETYGRVLRLRPAPPGKRVAGLPRALDAIVMRGLERRANNRFANALEMATALDAVSASAPVRREELAEWLSSMGGDMLRKRAHLIEQLRGSLAAPRLGTRAPLHVRRLAPTLPGPTALVGVRLAITPALPNVPAFVACLNPFMEPSVAPWMSESAPCGHSRARTCGRGLERTLHALLFVAALLWGFIVTRMLLPVTTFPELPPTAMVTL